MKKQLLKPKRRKRISLNVYQRDFFPAFAAFEPGGKRHSRAILNVGLLMSLVSTKDIPAKNIPSVVADCIFHEFLHAVEEWAGVAFSEKRVHRLVNLYRDKYDNLDSVSNGSNVSKRVLQRKKRK